MAKKKKLSPLGRAGEIAGNIGGMAGKKIMSALPSFGAIIKRSLGVSSGMEALTSSVKDVAGDIFATRGGNKAVDDSSSQQAPTKSDSSSITYVDIVKGSQLLTVLGDILAGVELLLFDSKSNTIKDVAIEDKRSSESAELIKATAKSNKATSTSSDSNDSDTDTKGDLFTTILKIKFFFKDIKKTLISIRLAVATFSAGLLSIPGRILSLGKTIVAGFALFGKGLKAIAKFLPRFLILPMTILATIKSLMNAFKADNLIDGISTFIADMISFFTFGFIDAGELKETIATGIRSIGDKITAFISDMIDSIANIFDDIKSGIMDFFVNPFTDKTEASTGSPSGNTSQSGDTKNVSVFNSTSSVKTMTDIVKNMQLIEPRNSILESIITENQILKTEASTGSPSGNTSQSGDTKNVSVFNSTSNNTTAYSVNVNVNNTEATLNRVIGASYSY